MNRTDMIGLAEEMTQVLLNQQQLDTVTRFWPEDMSWRGPLGHRVGAYHFIDTVSRPFFRAFPDYIATNDVWVADESEQLVAAWGHYTATHRDTFNEVPATGKPVDIHYMDIWLCRDGLLIDNWVQVDHASFLNQVGTFEFTEVLPGIAAAPESPWQPVADVDDTVTADDAAAWTARAPGIVHSVLTDLLNGESPAALPDTALWHGPLGFGTRSGRDIRDLGIAAAVRTAFPDLSATADFWLCDPFTRRVAVWGYLHGTQAGPYLGVEPAADPAVRVSYMTFCQLDGADAVQQLFTQIDNTTFLRDNGVLPQLREDPNQFGDV